MQTIWQLLNNYRKNTQKGKAVRPVFHGIDGFDAYNPTAAFNYQNKKMICVRVEKRKSETSRVIFFEEKEKDAYYIMKGWKSYSLQDPCLSYIQGYYILGGTEVFSCPQNQMKACWRTVFYRGTIKPMGRRS